MPASSGSPIKHLASPVHGTERRIPVLDEMETSVAKPHCAAANGLEVSFGGTRFAFRSDVC